MSVPFASTSRDHASLEAEFIHLLRGLLRDSAFVAGPAVAAFEHQLASWLGVPEVVTVQSGTTALIAALSALGIGRGDEVITVPNTFVATVGAIHAVGATPTLVDVEPEGLLMDPERLAGAVTPRTKAIIPVHLFGLAAQMDDILAVAERHGIPVVEDACQSIGATVNGTKTGNLGRAGCFSFYPGKNLGALGEGGAVVTSDAELARQVRRFRNHGGIAKYEHVIPGINGRLDTLQCGFLSIKLAHLDGWLDRRRACAARYVRGLEGLPLRLPAARPAAVHTYHLFVIRTPLRDALCRHLAQHGIGHGIHYPTPIHRLPAYEGLVQVPAPLHVAERACSEVLSLPMFGTMTDAEVDEVSECVRGFFESRRAEEPR